jgi:3alpha(or 20beta)-hydroxysteroid dehydrogenase
MDRAKGKVAIVTGGARGLGEADARLLVAEGARVVLTDVRDEEGQRVADQLGADARYLHHDVTSESDWSRVIAATEEAFGPVSVLVNNAGISIFAPIESMDEAAYRRIIDVNQVSTFLGMRSVLASMKRAGSGSIINISSVAGLIGTANVVAYTASKFAVRGMTKSAAVELAPHNIRVNCIHPGMIDTPINARTPANEATLEACTAAIPARRVGRPEEIAHMVLLLATNEMTFATGAEFVIDGGFTCQ